MVKEMPFIAIRKKNPHIQQVLKEFHFINSAIVDYWAQTILLSEIQRIPEKTGYARLILLLLDGCSSHFWVIKM